MSRCLFLPLSSPLRVPVLPPLPLPHFSCPDCSFASSSSWVRVVIEKTPRQKPLSINHGRAGRMLGLEKSSSRRMAPLDAGGWTYLGGLRARTARVRVRVRVCPCVRVRVSVCPCACPCPCVCPPVPGSWGHATAAGGSLRAPLPLPGGFDASPCLRKSWQQLGSAWTMMQSLAKWESILLKAPGRHAQSHFCRECRAFAIGCAEGLFCVA